MEHITQDQITLIRKTALIALDRMRKFEIALKILEAENKRLEEENITLRMGRRN